MNLIKINVHIVWKIQRKSRYVLFSSETAFFSKNRSSFQLQGWKSLCFEGSKNINSTTHLYAYLVNELIFSRFLDIENKIPVHLRQLHTILMKLIACSVIIIISELESNSLSFLVFIQVTSIHLWQSQVENEH